MNTARAPDAKVREKVIAEYKKGKKPKELSEQTGVSYNTVKSWIAREKKREKLEEATRKKDASSPRKKGAPLGSKNAKGNRGGSAPKRNQNAKKHGAYSQIYWDTIDEEEEELIEEMPEDEELLLVEQIRLFSIRERRIMKAINRYRNDKSPLSLDFSYRAEQKRSFDSKEDEELYAERMRVKVENNEIPPGRPYKTYTQTQNKDYMIARLESELSNVQAKKTKAIESLSKVRLQKELTYRQHDLHDLQKELLDAQIEHMDAQTNKILGTNVDLEDTSEIEGDIYESDT